MTTTAKKLILISTLLSSALNEASASTAVHGCPESAIHILPNSTIDYNGMNDIDDVVTYTCDRKALNPDNDVLTSTCGTDGVWSTPISNGAADSCPDAPEVCLGPIPRIVNSLDNSDDIIRHISDTRPAIGAQVIYNCLNNVSRHWNVFNGFLRPKNLSTVDIRHVNLESKVDFKVDFTDLQSSQVEVDFINRLLKSKVESKVEESRKVESKVEKSIKIWSKVAFFGQKSRLFKSKSKKSNFFIDFLTFDSTFQLLTQLLTRLLKSKVDRLQVDFAQVGQSRSRLF